MDLEAIRNWVRDAVIDDWRAAPGRRPSDQLALDRDGFRALAVLREERPSLSIWGPDGLLIKAPASYSWRACRDALKRCDECPDYVGPTYRAGFAERVCAACEKKLEQWTDRVTRDGY